MDKWSNPKKSFVAWLATTINLRIICDFWFVSAFMFVVALFAEFMAYATSGSPEPKIPWTATNVQIMLVLDIFLAFHALYGYWYTHIREQ